MPPSLAPLARIRSCLQKMMVLATVVLAACGGGGGGGGSSDPEVTLDRRQVSFDVETGETASAARVTGTVDKNGYNGAVYVLATSDAPGLSQVALSFSSDASTAWADISPDTSLSPGTYSGTLSLHACRDQACQQEFSGSPYRIAYTVTVRQGLVVTPASGGVTTVSGTTGTQRYTVQLPAGVTSFTVDPATLPDWVTLEDVTATGYTLRSRSMPVGDRSANPVVRAGGRTFSTTFNLSSTMPEGGQHDLSVTPMSLDLATVEGSSVTADVAVTPPTWKPTLTALASYTSGGATGWLSALATATGYRLTADAASLPAGTYTALLTVSGDGYTLAQNVSVALTVGPGLVQVAARQLLVHAETSSAALSSSVPIQLAGGPVRAWTAASDQSWLVVDTPSGSTGGNLTYHVDTAGLAAQTNRSVRSARITVNAGGVITPMVFDVAVDKQLPELRYAMPSVRTAGLAGSVILSGAGFSWLTDPSARVSISGLSGTTVTRLSDTALRLSLPAAAAGSYTVRVSNALGLASTGATVQVLNPAAAPAASLPQTGTKRALLIDASRQALLVLNEALGAIQRWSWAGGSWQSTGSQSIAGLNGIALSPDANTLVASTSSGEVQLLDPVGLTLRSRHSIGSALTMGSGMDWGLPVTHDGRVWLANGVGWNNLWTFDLVTLTAAAVPTGNLSTWFYYGPWGTVSGNGERLLLTQTTGLSPQPPMLFVDARDGALQTAPLAETYFYKAAFNEDASRLALMDHAKVVDGNFGTVGQIVLPTGQSPAVAQFAPDGRKLYVLGVAETFYATGAPLPTVWVLDATAAAAGTTQLPVLGSFDLTASYTYTCNWQGGGDTGCLAAPQMRLAPDGRTLFFAGPTAILSLPIPDAVQALKAGRSKAQRAFLPGTLPRTVYRWGQNQPVSSGPGDSVR